MQLNLSHQQYLVQPGKIGKVTVIGVGSVGSHLVHMLAKMGVEDIEVWDNDILTSDNIPMSYYGYRDVGSAKVHALQKRIQDDTGTEIRIHEEMYAGQKLSGAYVVSCVDTMAARKIIWDRVRGHPMIKLFSDTRTNRAFIDIVTVRPLIALDVQNYDELWFPDEEAERQTCGTHGVIFATSRAAEIVASNIATFSIKDQYNWRVTERCDTLERIHG